VADLPVCASVRRVQRAGEGTPSDFAAFLSAWRAGRGRCYRPRPARVASKSFFSWPAITVRPIVRLAPPPGPAT
jgi:hypothetical protein